MKLYYRFLTSIFLFFMLISLVLAACEPLVSGPNTTLTFGPTQITSSTQNPAASSNEPTATKTSSLTGTGAVPGSTPTQSSAGTATTVPAEAAAPEWKLIANGLEHPVGLVDVADGSGRLLVLEQAGRIRVFKNGLVLPDPFLDITDKVESGGNEQGLLGIALHPKFTSNGFFYLNYVDLNNYSVIARYTVSANPDIADKNSEKMLLHIQQPFPNHKGGQLVFGPDGYLYAGLGDGGSQGDPHLNGQSLNTLLGKLLRIDVDHGDPYAIPGDNPFAKGGGLPEIWAYGLRNPWRFSFDRQTGDLYIADVGQDLYEEIDYLPAGSPGGTNFGWSYREGLHSYKGSPPAGLNIVEPVWEYGHNLGCSVIGGFTFGRSKLFPDLQGLYIYGDYCSGNVWGLQRSADGKWQNRLLFQTGFNISSFAQDQSGDLYLLDLQGGGIYKLG
ncbi:MAG TPA: PQQ-dependent sugar dehydrogenase [Anaerolineaceae bacterium]